MGANVIPRFGQVRAGTTMGANVIPRFGQVRAGTTMGANVIPGTTMGANVIPWADPSDANHLHSQLVKN